MKKLSLVNLYKAEIKKNMLAQIKGGTDVKCLCSTSNPLQSTKQSGGPSDDLCACGTTETSSVSAQTRPSVF